MKIIIVKKGYDIFILSCTTIIIIYEERFSILFYCIFLFAGKILPKILSQKDEKTPKNIIKERHLKRLKVIIWKTKELKWLKTSIFYDIN